ncbi:type 4a pilus biogenesis protein PilO [Patescibacteria group bacterium]
MDATSIFKSNYFQLRLYAVLSVILFLIIGYFTFNNVMKFLDLRTDITTNNSIFTSLNTTESRISSELETVKEENKELTQNIQSELELVFPGQESHTSLTRVIEQFADDIHRLKDPFIINNLNYSKAEISEQGNYSVLPFKMTIHSSYTNFFKFLEFVEGSGTLSDKTRLVDLQSIIINFVSPSGTQGNLSGRDEINFNVTMNTYFRSVPDTTKK